MKAHKRTILSLCGSIHDRASAMICARLEQAGHADLAPTHGSILICLYTHGPLPMHRIAEEIGRKKNTVTVLVNKLLELGYVSKRADADDARVSLISLTEKGEAFRPVFFEISRELNSRLFKGISAEEIEVLSSLLEKCESNL